MFSRAARIRCASGASANGITGAEFRLEFSTTAGYSTIVWAVNPLAAGASLDDLGSATMTGSASCACL